MLQNVHIWQTTIKYTHKEEQSMDLWSDVHRTYVWIMIHTDEQWYSAYSNAAVQATPSLTNLDNNSRVYSMYITLHTPNNNS